MGLRCRFTRLFENRRSNRPANSGGNCDASVIFTGLIVTHLSPEVLGVPVEVPFKLGLLDQREQMFKGARKSAFRVLTDH